MIAPLSIDPRTLQQLDSGRFHCLCNTLLRLESYICGIEQRFIDTTVNEREPDGGIDARLDARTAEKPSNWIPEGISAWQYKSGRFAHTQLRKELKKPGVINAMSQGATYCILCSNSIADKQLQLQKSLIEKAYKEANQVPRYRFYTIDQIAEWLSAFPAIAHKFNSIDLHGWYNIEDWRKLKLMENPFIPDKARQDLIETIHAHIKKGKSILRVGGCSGVGKTRTVLEALNKMQIREIVLYHPDAESGASSLLWDLYNSKRRGTGILVIDECTPQIVDKMIEEARILPDGYSVILIGQTDRGARGNSIELGQMKDEDIEKILEYYIPGIFHPLRRQIADRCRGYPKLAVLVGEAYRKKIKTGSITSLSEIEEDETVIEYLEKHWLRIVGEKALILLKGLSLLTRTGWREDMANEGFKVCTLVGVDFTLADHYAGELIKIGVVSSRGRFLYVTPDLLAIHLTRRFMKEPRFIERIKDFLGALSEDGRTRFVERLRQVGESEEGRSIINTLFSKEFFFNSLEELNKEGIAHLVRLLSGTFPDLFLSRIQFVIDRATIEELRAMIGTRRDLVWALEELAWYPEYFPQAAKLLLKLSIAENEDYANNATGIWRSLFQVILAGTATPYPDRIPILIEALHSEDPIARVLGLEALSAALQTGTIIGSVGPSGNIGKAAPGRWQPASYREWRTIIEGLIPYLIERIHDSDFTVHQIALKVVRDRLYDLINLELVNHVREIFSSIKNLPMAERIPILEALDRRLHHTDKVTEKYREDLVTIRNILSGRTIQEQVQEITGPWSYPYSTEEQERYQKKIRDISMLLIKNPQEMSSLLPWLASGEANSGYLLGREIGLLDDSETLLPLITSFWNPSIADHRFFTGYLQGLNDKNGEEWIENVLDDLSNEDRTASLAAFGTWQCTSTERGAKRLTKLLQNKKIPLGFTRNLVLGFWAKSVEVAALEELLTACVQINEPQAIAGALDILAQYVNLQQQFPEMLHNVAWLLLEQSIAFWGNKLLDVDNWCDLAKQMINQDAIRVAKLCVIVAKSIQEYWNRKDLQGVLQLCVAKEPRKVLFEILGPEIESNIVFLRSLQTYMEGRSLIDSFDPSLIIEWIREDPDKRLAPVAYATTVPDHPSGSLARELIIHWGDRREVYGPLSSNFHSGTWFGPESGWIDQKISVLQNWKDDPDDAIKKWAVWQEGIFLERKERAKIRDEEIDFS